MKKTHTTLSIDPYLLEEVKASGINISEVLEDALIAKLNLVKNIINDTMAKCAFCAKDYLKATPENPEGITFVNPDEKWICKRCLT